MIINKIRTLQIEVYLNLWWKEDMNYEDYRNAFTIVNESDGQPYTGAEGEYPFVVYNEEFTVMKIIPDFLKRVLETVQYWFQNSNSCATSIFSYFLFFYRLGSVEPNQAKQYKWN